MILSGIDGIRFCYFTERDVVRHRLVQDIITAYDRFEARRARNGDPSASPSGLLLLSLWERVGVRAAR